MANSIYCSSNNQLRKFIKYKRIILTFIFLFQVPFINSDSTFKILVFNSHQYRAGHFAFDKDGNMFIEYSKDNYRLFYGLKKDGNIILEMKLLLKKLKLIIVVEMLRDMNQEIYLSQLMQNNIYLV